MLFQPFQKATRRETPSFIDAAIAEGRFDMAETARQANMRDSAVEGGLGMYDRYEGEGGSLFGGEDAAAAPMMTEVAPIESAYAGTDLLAANAAVPEMGMAGMESALAGTDLLAGGGTAALEGAGLGATAGVEAAMPAAAEMFGATAAPAAVAGEGALAAMGPVGWAALLGLALTQM